MKRDGEKARVRKEGQKGRKEMQWRIDRYMCTLHERERERRRRRKEGRNVKRGKDHRDLLGFLFSLRLRCAAL